MAALDQPLRRQLYRVLADRGWTTRDDAAAVLGVARSVAAFHLDKLAAAGVVEVRFERTTGRQGPGAGRPSKWYRLAADELHASMPPRHYDLAGAVLAAAIDESTRTARPVADCVRGAAQAAGRRVGRAAVAREAGADGSDAVVLDVLVSHGYEPVVDEAGGITLANCPFHRLAEAHRELVCGMNLEFLAGVLEGAADAGRRARLAPSPGTCCVRIDARP